MPGGEKARGAHDRVLADLRVVGLIESSDLQAAGRVEDGPHRLALVDRSEEDRLESADDEVPPCEGGDERLVGVWAEFEARLDTGGLVPVDDSLDFVVAHGPGQGEVDGAVEPGAGGSAAGDAAGNFQNMIGQFGEGLGLPALFEACDFEHVHPGLLAEWAVRCG